MFNFIFLLSLISTAHAATVIPVDALLRIFESVNMTGLNKSEELMLMVSSYADSALYLTPSKTGTRLALSVEMAREDLDIFEYTERIVLNHPAFLPFAVLIKDEMAKSNTLFKNQTLRKYRVQDRYGLLSVTFSEAAKVDDIKKIVAAVDLLMSDDPCIAKHLLN